MDCFCCEHEHPSDEVLVLLLDKEEQVDKERLCDSLCQRCNAYECQSPSVDESEASELNRIIGMGIYG